MDVKIKSFVPVGEVDIPSSKSDAHRALIMAYISNEKCVIKNVVFSQDVIATLNALKSLGANFYQEKNCIYFEPSVRKIEECIINVNASGSTLRFLIPIASNLCKKVRFIGEESLFSRPLSVYEEIMEKQKIIYKKGSNYLEIEGSFKCEDYTIVGNVSSQFITGLLFLLCLNKVKNQIKVLKPFQSKEYIDITVNVMKKFGVNVAENEDVYAITSINFNSIEYSIEKDYSQMAFFAVLGSLKGKISISNMNENSLQGDKKIIDILIKSGANIKMANGNFVFEQSSLISKEIDLSSCIDLGPILFVFASFCEGTTRIFNTKRLKIKESDRVESMKQELEKVGVDIKCFDDEVLITGKNEYHGNYQFDCHNDHRVAMALSVFACVNDGECVIKNAECVNKSYPNFYEDLFSLKGEN